MPEELVGADGEVGVEEDFQLISWEREVVAAQSYA